MSSFSLYATITEIDLPISKTVCARAVKGNARLAPWEEVRRMWRWWLLEWVPEKDKRPLLYDDPFLDRSIIWVEPVGITVEENK